MNSSVGFKNTEFYLFISLENNSLLHTRTSTLNTGTRGADMEHYRRGIYSISQFHVSETYNAVYETDDVVQMVSLI